MQFKTIIFTFPFKLLPTFSLVSNHSLKHTENYKIKFLQSCPVSRHHVNLQRKREYVCTSISHSILNRIKLARTYQMQHSYTKSCLWRLSGQHSLFQFNEGRIDHFDQPRRPKYTKQVDRIRFIQSGAIAFVFLSDIDSSRKCKLRTLPFRSSSRTTMLMMVSIATRRLISPCNATSPVSQTGWIKQRLRTWKRFYYIYMHTNTMREGSFSLSPTIHRRWITIQQGAGLFVLPPRPPTHSHPYYHRSWY